MIRKTAGLAITILCLLGLVAAPTSASAAAADVSPPGCLGQLYSVFLGQGIAVTCVVAGEDKSGYSVVAHCSNGGAFWFVLGTYTPYGFAPSVAECNGGLLAPAWVGGYHVVEI